MRPDDSNASNNEQSAVSPQNKILTIVGSILCVVFGILLIVNLTIIIKGNTETDSPPSIFGVMPLVVLSGSMSGDAPDHIEVGDLIFVREVKDASELTVNTVITFREGQSLVTHRIIGINDPDKYGNISYQTKGDANNLEDKDPVYLEDIVGIYSWRIPFVGDVALFMQTPLGMILFIGLPLGAYLLYDVFRRKRYDAEESDKNTKLEEEVRALRELAARQEAERKAQEAISRTAELEAELARLRALTSQNAAPKDDSTDNKGE